MCKQLLFTFILALSIGSKLMAETNLMQIINNLNDHLSIELNLIIVGHQVTPDTEYLLKNTNKSILIVTKEMANTVQKDDMQMKDSQNVEIRNINEMFSHNIMTIVFVKSDENNGSFILHFQSMANVAKVSLRLLHATHILWVTSSASVSELQEFSHICWDNGFTKVLFYNNGELYVYTRFPVLKVSQLLSLDLYYQLKDIQNFHQYPFRFPITNSPPRCYRFTDHNGQLYNAGYMYRILMMFIENFNFTFSEYPHDYRTDNKGSLLDALNAQLIDAVPFLTYRNRKFDSSSVIWNGNVYVLVPNAKPIPKYQYFQRPFKSLVWLLYCAVIAIASFIIAGLLYAKNHIWDLSKSFIYVFSLVIYQNHSPLSLRSIRFNALYIMLTIYGIIMVNYYLCVLSSLLVSTLYENQVKTFADLGSLNLPLLITKSDSDYYQQLPVTSPEIVQLITLADGIYLDELRRNLSTSCLHAAFEDKLKFYMFQQRYMKVPRLRFMNEVLFSAPIYFTLRHNLPYRQLFNRYLNNIWASGLFAQLYTNIEWLGIRSGQIQYIMEEGETKPLLTLEYFYSPLLFYAGGIAISFLTFVIELLHFKYRQIN